MTDPYLLPDSDCLRNKLGLTDPEKLAEAEQRISLHRDSQLNRETLPGEYNLQHLQRFHEWLFQDVYDWAGQTRTVNIHKDGPPFCSWQYLDDEVSSVLTKLATDRWLIGLAHHAFLDKVAYYYGELNARHPFREGNGRTQRAFLRQLSAAAGGRLDWSNLNEEDNIAASRQNLITANHTELVRVLNPVVTRI
ncbi:MAG: Fic/DOC family protein [Pseudonocardiaceae bacterium]